MPHLPRHHPGHGRAPGVEIDYCPSCRGIWLDRGELDKLLERADSGKPVAAGAAAAAAQPGQYPARDFEDSDFQQQQRYPRSRKKSWLHDIFN